MFKLSHEVIFSWPVKVIEPDPSKAGRLLEHVFEATFAIVAPETNRARDDERKAILARMVGDTPIDELKAIEKELDEHDFSTLKTYLRGWSKIADDDGRPIPFNDDTLREVYAHARVKNALIRAYQEALSEDKARLGN